MKYQAGGKTLVLDGPFTETKEVLGGYWIIEVPGLADAISWARQAPCPAGEFIEIREVYGADDFGEEAAAIGREQQAQMDANAARDEAAKS